MDNEQKKQTLVEIRNHPYLFFIEAAVDASMKHLLVVNDRFGTKVMREAALEELNKLRKLLVSEGTKIVWQLKSESVEK